MTTAPRPRPTGLLTRVLRSSPSRCPAGDVRAAAALVPRMVAVGHLLGDDLTTRVSRLQAALDCVEGLQEADRERAQLRAAMAAAYMLDRRLEKAIDHGEHGRQQSQR